MSGIEYTLRGKSYQLDDREKLLIEDNPPLQKEDWVKHLYSPIKTNIKSDLYRNQYARCAYCRKELEIGGKYEHIDHIIPKSLKPKWLLNPKNLVLSCPSCNGDKRMAQTLNNDFLDLVDFPNTTDAFKIINPHFDNWHEHLLFEDDIFIVPIINTKGEKTIEICHLYRFHVIMNRAREYSLGQKEPIRRILNKLQNNTENSQQVVDGLYNAIQEFSQLMNDNPNFS